MNTLSPEDRSWLIETFKRRGSYFIAERTNGRALLHARQESTNEAMMVKAWIITGIGRLRYRPSRNVWEWAIDRTSDAIAFMHLIYPHTEGRVKLAIEQTLVGWKDSPQRSTYRLQDLSEGQCEAISNDLKAGKTTAAIAEQYHVSQNTVLHLRRKRWRAKGGHRRGSVKLPINKGPK